VRERKRQVRRRLGFFRRPSFLNRFSRSHFAAFAFHVLDFALQIVEPARKLADIRAGADSTDDEPDRQNNRDTQDQGNQRFDR
jgi:hypothetical protein